MIATYKGVEESKGNLRAGLSRGVEGRQREEKEKKERKKEEGREVVKGGKKFLKGIGSLHEGSMLARGAAL